MERSKKIGLILGIIFVYSMILTMFGCLITVATDSIEVPLSPHHPNSNKDWWLYQFEGKGNQQKCTTSDGVKHGAFSNTNCGPACSAMVINYLRGKGLKTEFGSFRSKDIPDVKCTARGNYCEAYLKAMDYPEEIYKKGYYNSDWSYPGATFEQVQNVLSLEDIKSHIIKGGDYKEAEAYLKKLEDAVDQGSVCIACVNPKEYVDTKITSHWTVFYGYNDTHVFLNDPGWGRFRKEHPISKSKFTKALWNAEPKSWRKAIIIDTTLEAKPVLTSPLRITPEIAKYYVGDTIRAEFTINNIGGAPITLDKLLVGGRFNDGMLPNGEYPDFTSQSTTLQPDFPYKYTGTLTLTHPGEYKFFIAYYIENPTSEEKKLLDENNWNTCIGLGEGLTDADRIEDIRVFPQLEKNILYVPDDYPTIQAAVDAASAGDRIIVKDGIYYENVDVTKSLTIRSTSGNPANTIVQAKSPSDDVFYVTADYVNISGFTVEGATLPRAGICLLNSDYCNISSNKCSYNWRGIISLGYSSNNTISGNDVSDNNYGGISLHSSSDNTVSRNTFINDGLVVSESSYHNAVEDNTVNNKPLVYLEGASDYKVKDAGQVILINCRNIKVENLNLSNTYVGIKILATEDSIIADNTVSNNNWVGIYLYDSSNNNTITGNNACYNNYAGIFLGYYSSSNTITGNNVSGNNGDGVSLWHSSNNTISGNDVSGNNYTGIILESSSNNSIYLNNFINNSYNVYSYDPTNIWNSTEEITYTYKANQYTNYMGNYWDDYKGTDTNKDGIGDKSYSINSDNDYYPLMERFENYIRRYDLIWRSKAPMPTARSWTAAVVYNGKIYVVGGCSCLSGCRQFYNAVRTLEVYDPLNNSWEIKPPMSIPRVGPAVAAVDGKIYVFGGFNRNWRSANPTVEIYNIATDTWSTGAPMSTPRSWARAVVLDGKIYVLGGVGYHYYNVCERYDPATNTGTSCAPFKTARYLHAAVGANGKIYIIGGDSWEYGYNEVYLDIQEYNPLTNSWITKTPMPTAANGIDAIVAGNKIWVFGGGGFSCDYDIATDQWENKTSNMNISSSFSLAYLDGVIYRFGGGGWGPTLDIAEAVEIGPAENNLPNPPANLAQFKSDGETVIAVGGMTDERTVILKGNISDPDGDKVKLQVELRRLDEYNGAFLQRFTQESNLENSNSRVGVPVYGLIDGNYHWQARTVDEH
jgi:parallel beta-helix repeat protein